MPEQTGALHPGLKNFPELRHLLAHVVQALEALAQGEPDAALYEIETIRGVVSWDNDEDFYGFCRGWAKEHGWRPPEPALEPNPGPVPEPHPGTEGGDPC